MTARLPYHASPGTIANALEKIKTAATPPTVNGDFVAAKLGIKGGAGRAIPPLLKKLGFVSGDGTPTVLYTRFRNSNAQVSGVAVAEAIRHGYKALFDVNEYVYDLPDKDLKGLVVQVTGLEPASSVVRQICGSFRKLRDFAEFEPEQDSGVAEESAEPVIDSSKAPTGAADLRVGYTINLNLPPTTNVEVFNAIFKSLREHLVRD